MKSVFALFLVLGLGASSAQGTDILWLNLKSVFSYRDLSTVCSNKSYPATLYFGAEMEGLTIKKAVFQDSLSSTSSKIILTAEEIKDIVLHQDKNDQLWLKTVSMKGRLLNWMFFEAGGGMFSSCKPPQTLASIDPASFTFQFGVETVELEADSNLGKFRGKLKDGAAYQAEIQFSERPQQQYASDGLDVEENFRAYPRPPWTRSVSASGNGSSRPSAQISCESDARFRVRPLESTCRNNGGFASSSHPFCSTCNKFGSQWRCSESVRVRCNAYFEDEVELESEETRYTSPVFSDRQDCRAIAMNNAGLCRSRDCRGVLYHSQSYCQSNDCRAIARGLVGYCQTRDCRAVVYNSVGFCESANCRAVIYKNFGMCR